MDVMAKVKQYATTKQGDELAAQLNPYIGTTNLIRSVCAGLVRNANRLHNLAVLDCNGSPIRDWIRPDMSPRAVAHCEELAVAEEERGQAEAVRREAVVRDLVTYLPEHDGGPWQVVIQGDPRGRVVYLVCPDGREITVERGRNLM